MSLEPFFNNLSNGNIQSREDSMKYEALRLATFHSRPRAYGTVSASRLANSGFYYTGESDAVECFTCNVRIADWDSMGRSIDPLAVHMQRAPDCIFLNQNRNGNIPYANQHPSEAAMRLQKQFANASRSRDIDGNLLGYDKNHWLHNESQDRSEHARDRVRGGTEHSTSRATVPPSHTNAIAANSTRRNNSSSNSNATSSILTPAPTQSSATTRPSFEPTLPPPAPPTFDNDINGMPNFKDEQVRVDSFNYWPNASAARPSEMAKAGFYYLGTEDRVQCAFCKGVLRNWDPTDDAMAEHKKHFPACPFIREPKNVGNIPRTDQISGVQFRENARTDEEIEDCIKGIMTEQAYHPHMSMKIERLNSYINFHSDSCRTPEEFSEAGFFYTGQGDNVKCFFCDGGLRNWERNDDPWLEHARWFPKCGYLRIKKGDDFVKEIRKTYAPPGTKKPRVRKLKQKHKITEAEVALAMRGEMVQDVKDMGYAHSQIRGVMERRLGELGTSFPNVESLIESLYEQEELDERGPHSYSGEENSDSETVSLEPEETHDKGSVETADDSSKTTGGKKKKKNKKPKSSKSDKERAAHVNMLQYMSAETDADLEAEVRKLQDERMCKVCMDSEVNIVFLKCGHLVCCSDCAPALRHCPICRQTIRGTIRVFLSHRTGALANQTDKGSKQASVGNKDTRTNSTSKGTHKPPSAGFSSD